MKKIYIILIIFVQFSIISAQSSIPDSRQLDDLLNKLDNTEKTKSIDDYVFLKRIYLNIVGRIPQLKEIIKFRKDTSKNKREKLIKDLLGSEGYNSHMYNFFSNILRVKAKFGNNHNGGSYIDWIKDAISKNKPYDVFVKDLIGAEGPMWKKGNGATGYYVRDRFMLQDNLANTMRIFNGTRLECAQCHDHPFEAWKQKDFFSLLAFNGGLNYTVQPPVKGNLKKDFQYKDLPPKDRGFLRKLFALQTDGVTGSGTGAIRLPKDYHYDDAKPNQIVTAKSIMGEKIEITDVELIQQKNKKNKKRRKKSAGIAKPIGSRKVFADWLTSPKNPHFTTVIANRMWKKAYGYAIIEPLDDMTSDSKSRNKILMTFLERKMKTFKYDLKRFQAMIYNSKHFQSAASALENEEKMVQTPLIMRMTAEQIWDSVLTLVVEDIDAPIQPQWSGLYDIYERLQVNNKEDLIAEVEKIMTENRTRDKSRIEIKGIQKEYHKKLRKLYRKKDHQEAKKVRAEMLSKIEKIEKSNNMMSSFRSSKQKSSSVARASQRSNSPRASDMLSVFGASGGDVIEGAHKEPIPTQALFLLNGALAQAGIYNVGSQLMEYLETEKTTDKKINAAFLSILCRNANAEEIKLFMSEQSKKKIEIFQDSITTLLCSAEFMFIQ